MSTEVGKLNGTQIHAGTAPGAAYVNKVTHPPSPMTSEYQGRPDCSAPNVVLMELKAESNVPPILTIPTSPSAVKTINPSSILFVQTSGAVVMNYIFFWLADTEANFSGWVQPQGQSAVANTFPAITQAVGPAVKSSGYNFDQWQVDIGSHRKTYKSSTYYLNATNFNNQGIVTSAKFKPDIVSGASLQQLFDLHSTCSKSMASLTAAVRASCAHLGLSVIGNNFDDFQYVTKDGIKLPGDTFSYQIWDFGVQPPGSGQSLQYSAGMYWNRLFPQNSSDMLVTSPKAATRPARDGAFVVQQQEDEIIPWVANHATTKNVAAQPNGLNLSFMRYIDSVQGLAVYIPLYATSSNTNTTSPYTAEVPWSSLDWSYTLFEGITVPPTVGTTLTSVPYITVKSFVGLELQPRPASSLVTFQRTLPLPDSDAIKMAIGIMHARPDSLPAAANDLGSIAATAVKFIPTAVQWLKDIFGGSSNKASSQPTKPVKKVKKIVKQQTPANTGKLNKSVSSIDARINALTQAINRMQVAANKTTAPATRLPSYTENKLPPKAQRVRRVKSTAPTVNRSK